MTKKILVVIVDALDWNLLHEFQCTPYLDKLRKEGLSGCLTSSDVPLTPIALGEFYSGHESPYNESSDLMSVLADASLTAHDHMIFDDLSLLYDTGIFDLPCLGRVRTVGKFWLAGVTGDSSANYNNHTRIKPSYLKEHIIEYPTYGTDFMKTVDIVTRCRQTPREFDRFRYMKILLEKEPCELFATYTRILDAGCHGWISDLPHNFSVTPLEILYKHIDKWVYSLAHEVFIPDTILLLSDHGFDPRKKQGIDWKAHSPDGVYILHGTDRTGEESRRIYQLHWLLKEICGFGKDQEVYIENLRAKISKIKSKIHW